METTEISQAQSISFLLQQQQDGIPLAKAGQADLTRRSKASPNPTQPGGMVESK
jgi:hypothetical protein